MSQTTVLAETEAKLGAIITQRERQRAEAIHRAEQAESAYHELAEQVTLVQAQAELQGRELAAVRASLVDARAQLPNVIAERDSLHEQVVRLQRALDDATTQLAAALRERERLGLRRFHRRGLIGVRAEFALYCIALNLKKALSHRSVVFVFVVSSCPGRRRHQVALVWVVAVMDAFHGE